MDSRRNIPPNPPRWRPNPDPASIAVPGLDTSAPVHDQIEQMEQLITLKLQNIDENFAKIHHLLANKVLPALKRYAVATEPVREAAKFWTSFYEQAAQIQIPSFDEHSTVNEESQQPEMTSSSQDPAADTSSILEAHGYNESSIASTNVSFMPGQDALSSTPATARMGRVQNPKADDSLWDASLDPSLIHHAHSAQDTTESSMVKPMPSAHFDELTPNPRHIQPQLRSEKGKAKESEPLLRNVLRHNLYPINTSPTTDISTVTSPLKYRGKPKTPVPKNYNPFLGSNQDPSHWDGIVDLSQSSSTTPNRFRKNPSANRTPAEETEDDSFDGLPPGMSPPVMMSPARPPRSMAELGLFKLGQTPMKDASARITRDLVRDIQIQSGRTTRDGLNSRIESTMSSMPTPPSFSRYRPFNDTSDSLVMDSSLESMMRRVGLNVPSSVSTGGSTSGSILRSHASLASHDSPEDPASSPTAKFGTREEAIPHSHAHDDDLDSDSDSMDEINNTAHPSHAFLMASAGMRNDSDDSFESNHSSDSLGDDHEGAELGLAPPHPFAANVEDDGFDDSYEDEMFDRLHGEVQEETLFGVLPHQRMQVSNALYQGQGLRMLGEDLLQDTIGIGARIGHIEESPTPASRQ